MKKIIFILFLILSFTKISYSYIPDRIERINEIKINNEEKIYKIPEINFGNIKVNYEIGYDNKISGKYIFYPINLKFSKKINGTLEIFTKKDNRINEKENLYKIIKIENSNFLKTYFYPNSDYRTNYFFYLNINGERKKLEVKNYHGIISNYLYISNYDIRDYFSTTKIPEFFNLLQFEYVNVSKENLTKKEIEILKNYVYFGGNLLININNFGDNKNYKKEVCYINKYNQNICITEEELKKNSNNKKYNQFYNNTEKKFLRYKYGFGYIYDNINLKNLYKKNYSAFFYEDDIKKILIDKSIKDKFVPFYVILFFIIAYFILFIIINFFLAKKYKKNKLFTFFSIPILSIFFLITIISISYYYKGFNDIENKVQVNLHKDGKILSYVFLANFSVNGGDYNLNINKENYINNTIISNDHYRKIYSYKKLDFNNQKINYKLFGVGALNILYFYYYEISDEKTGEINKNLKEFKDINELINIILKKNNISQQLRYSKKYFDTSIEKITFEEGKTELMKKYSFGGKSNKNYIINIYYK